MDHKNTKSSLTFLQNKLSKNNIILITSKYVLYENNYYIKKDNIWGKVEGNFNKSFLKEEFLVVFLCLLFLLFLDLEDLKNENAGYKEKKK